MIVKLLTEHHLEFLSLTGGCRCRGLSESTLVKMSNCWKSHAMAQIFDRQTPISLGCSTRLCDKYQNLMLAHFRILYLLNTNIDVYSNQL